jgi:hypothetical protein
LIDLESSQALDDRRVTRHRDSVPSRAYVPATDGRAVSLPLRPGGNASRRDRYDGVMPSATSSAYRRSNR